jgi:hypothetical protein
MFAAQTPPERILGTTAKLSMMLGKRPTGEDEKPVALSRRHNKTTPYIVNGWTLLLPIGNWY